MHASDALATLPRVHHLILVNDDDSATALGAITADRALEAMLEALGDSIP